MRKDAAPGTLDGMIEVRELTKKYGSGEKAVTAVDHVTFTVRPGVVTGFLGPNGAGKSTTMRSILGLDRPTSGTATVNGREFRDAPAPLSEMGALLEAKAIDKGRSARSHLLALGATIGVGVRRVDEVLDLVGLTEVARKRAGGFSLGMGQRLGIAAALLGDPQTVMLDEPVNGLDPDGILWIRNLLKALAAEGRTVLISSHLMSEMSLTAEHLIVIGKGRLIADLPITEMIAAASRASVLVRSPDAARLRDVLVGPDVSITGGESAHLNVSGLTAAQIGDIAAANGIAIHELTPQRASLEEAFMEMTNGSIEFHGGTTVAGESTALTSKGAAA
jgi:ABC-2 type transport system ATP-binding protein